LLPPSHKRFPDVASEIANGTPFNWADLALKAGYYDQSHFINDFRQVIGISPQDYQNQSLDS